MAAFTAELPTGAVIGDAIIGDVIARAGPADAIVCATGPEALRFPRRSAR
jgi:hypothetical protein